MSEHIVEDMLRALGEDPEREGLVDTPKRVVKSWNELFSGYDKDPAEVLGVVFEDGACDEMVILKNIEGYSTCEHHVLPFSYRCHIGYIPNGKVVGVSKLARLTEVFAQRLQIQERMTSQIADMLVEVLEPKGVMVVVEGQHLCMLARGVKQHNSTMVTSAVRGVFESKDAARQEFLELTK